MEFGALIAKIVPLIIPVFLLCSWIYNTKSVKKKSDNDMVESIGGKQVNDKEESNKRISDKDMTS